MGETTVSCLHIHNKKQGREFGGVHVRPDWQNLWKNYNDGQICIKVAAI